MDSDKYLNIIKGFGASISSEDPFGLVIHQHTPESLPTNCIFNVINHIENNGGNIIYGWYFCSRSSPKYGDYLIATHHAIWQAPDTILIDITPFHQEEKHHPLTIEEGSILFQVDIGAEPFEIGIQKIPRPLKFFPVTESQDMMDYLEMQKQKEDQYYQNQFGISI